LHRARPDGGGALGWLWTCLEDERQERLLVAEYPELAALFDFLGDVALAAHPADAPHDPLARCLLWSWAHDSPLGAGGTEMETDAEGADAWAAIRPLVEGAWGAPASDDVTLIAQRILAQFGLDEHAALHLPSLCACAGGEAERDRGGGGDRGGGAEPPRAPRPPSAARCSCAWLKAWSTPHSMS
jgi:hypothetical protein